MSSPSWRTAPAYRVAPAILQAARRSGVIGAGVLHGRQTESLKPRTIAAQALGTIEPATRAVALPVHVSTTFIRDPGQPVSHRLQLRPARQRDRAPDRGRDRRARRRARGAAVRLRHGGRDQRGARAAAGLARRRAAGLLLGPARLAGERGAAVRLPGRSRRHVGPRGDPRRAKPDTKLSGSRRRPIRSGASPTSRPSRRSRMRQARSLGIDSTAATPVFTPAARARRRHRDAFGDQISQRPFRRGCRRARDRARRRAVGAHQAGARPSRRDPRRFEAWLLLRGLRTLEIRVKRAGRKRRAARASACEPSIRFPRALSGPADASRPRDRREADVRLWRHAVDPPEGRRARCDRCGRACRIVEARRPRSAASKA